MMLDLRIALNLLTIFFLFLSFSVNAAKGPEKKQKVLRNGVYFRQLFVYIMYIHISKSK